MKVADGSFYERNRFLYYLTMPISWLITFYVFLKKKFLKDKNVSNSILFDHFAIKLRLIKEGSKSWKALDIIYNHVFGRDKSFSGFLEDFWIGMMNAQSVRNRFKLIRAELKKILLEFRGEEEIRMISLACGSAQAVIEVLSDLKKIGIIVRVLLVDIDKSALIHAKRLASDYGVGEQIETMECNVFRIKKIASDFKPQVIEMLGLLDYLDYDIAVPLIHRIKSLLPLGGYFLTCNIKHNLEMHFLKHVINWPMIYRSEKELSSIVKDSGFNDFELIYEPLMIHGIIIAKNT